MFRQDWKHCNSSPIKVQVTILPRFSHNVLFGAIKVNATNRGVRVAKDQDCEGLRSGQSQGLQGYPVYVIKNTFDDGEQLLSTCCFQKTVQLNFIAPIAILLFCIHHV